MLFGIKGNFGAGKIKLSKNGLLLFNRMEEVRKYNKGELNCILDWFGYIRDRNIIKGFGNGYITGFIAGIFCGLAVLPSFVILFYGY